jgi:septal ring factor EnvC (AmiA/AmiB activator)
MPLLAHSNMNHSQSKQGVRRPSAVQSIDMKSKDQIRRHVPSPAPSEDGKALSPHEMKRRAQNRASQRAVRERKRTQAETLQHQVHEMQKRHDELLHSYHDKEEEVSALYDNIRELQHRLQALKAQISEPQSSISSSSFQFEPVVLDDPFEEWSGVVFQTPTGWDPQLQDHQQYFDESQFQAA